MSYVSTYRTFPFCVANSASPFGDGTIGYPFNRFFELYWRVKKWKCSASISATGDDFSGACSFSGAQIGGVPATEEMGLLVPGGARSFRVLTLEDRSGSWEVTGDFPDSGIAGIDVQFDLWWQVGDVDVSYKGSGESPLYYPIIKASFRFLCFDSVGNPSVMDYSFQNPSGGDSDEGNSISIWGESITAYQGDLAGTPASSVTFSASIEPLEWWPYDPGDGSPVWDSANGSRLRDPATIIRSGS